MKTPQSPHAPTAGWREYKTEILAGLLVAMALVPEAIAFAFVAGLHPLVGLYAAVIVVLITSAFGGRPGMISAAAGSLAVVMIGLVVQHGAEYLFAAVILMGLLQVIFGLLKWGKFIRMVPLPVMLGFVNGLAIVIFMAQFSQFTDKAGAPLEWGQTALYWMLGLIGLTMAIMHFLPRLTKAIPSGLVAIVAVSLLVYFFGIDTALVGDRASVEGSLSTFFLGDPSQPQLNGFHIPMVPFSWETLWIVLPYAVILMIIGTTESLLTMTLIDDLTQTRGQGNREAVALGAANCTAGMFGTMGGCALIGQSMINVKSGASRRLSGLVAGVGLILIILVFSSWIEQVPLAALIGLMFIVVLATFEWSSINLMRGMRRADVFVMLLVTGLTVVFDLAVAVISGVIVSALVFAWQHAQRIYATTRLEPKAGHEEQMVKVYELYGPLFFVSVHNFNQLFNPQEDPECVVIDFRYSRVYDHSGVEAIDGLTEKYKAQGKKLVLRHLSPECIQLLKAASDFVEINVSEDPHYHVSMGK
jgi:SulP family sulfate permease